MKARKRLSEQTVHELMEKAIFLMEDVSNKLDRLYECHRQATIRIDGDPERPSNNE